MSFVKSLDAESAKRALISLRRQAQIRQYAAFRRDDQKFDWIKFGDAMTNEMMRFTAHDYEWDGKITPLRWPRITLQTILCRGRHAIWKNVNSVPCEIRDLVQRGITKARERGCIVRTSDDIARMLGVTMQQRGDMQLYLIGAIDCPYEKRKELKRRERNNRQSEARRQNGVRPRKEYLAQAELKRKACKLAGISMATFCRRSSEEQKTLLERARKMSEV